MVDSVVAPFTVVAFDPGVTTGFARGTWSDGLMTVKVGQHDLDHIELYDQLDLLKPKYVITEEFEFRNRARKGLELVSREYIGIFELWCQRNKRLLFRQKASRALGQYYSNDKLKHDKLYVASKPHAMDALRHLLHWYTFGFGFQFNRDGYCG
jgi:hypothetical protein